MIAGIQKGSPASCNPEVANAAVSWQIFSGTQGYAQADSINVDSPRCGCGGFLPGAGG